MSTWRLPENTNEFVALGANTSVTGGVSVTAGSQSLGSWVELVSSLAEDYGPIIMYFQALNQDLGYFELGLGGSGSEQTIATGYIRVDRGGAAWCYLPVRLPAGERLAMRASNQSTQDYNTLVQAAIWSPNGPPPSSGSDLEGIEKAGSSSTHGHGVNVDPGGTAHTKSSWVEIVASTAADYKQFAIIAMSEQLTALTTGRWFFDIAIGGAGSEEIIIENHPIDADAGPDNTFPEKVRFFDRAIPSGTRIAARAQCSMTNATDRILEFGFLGFR